MKLHFTVAVPNHADGKEVGQLIARSDADGVVYANVPLRPPDLTVSESPYQRFEQIRLLLLCIEQGHAGCFANWGQRLAGERRQLLVTQEEPVRVLGREVPASVNRAGPGKHSPLLLCQMPQRVPLLDVSNGKFEHSCSHNFKHSEIIYAN